MNNSQNNLFFSFGDYDNFTLINKSIFVEVNNKSESTVFNELPSYLRELSSTAKNWVAAYVVVFFIAIFGNLLEFWAVLKRIRKRCSPMNLLLMHLCVADLLVVVLVVALEIGWRISIGWYAGRIMCKFLQFSRAFGLYLSSLVLICLTMDRYYAVLFPLKVVDASKRVKFLLGLAWALAAILASPQILVFDVRTHPRYTTFTQCTTMETTIEQANTILSICFMYFVPLFFILFGYGNIIYKLTKESSDSSSTSSTQGNLPALRRSDKALMDRAKIKTLKLTLVIVLVYIICWTPYILMTTWHVVDRESAEKVPHFIQECLFLMVVANSCCNPLVYGVFHSRCGMIPGGTGNSRIPAPTAGFTMSTFQSSRKFTIRNTPIKPPLKIVPPAAQAPSPMVQIQHVCLPENNVGLNSLLTRGKRSTGTVKVVEGVNLTVKINNVRTSSV